MAGSQAGSDRPTNLSADRSNPRLWVEKMKGIRGFVNWTKRHVILLIFLLAIGSAGGAIGTSPTFFHERHIVPVMVFVAWVVSWGVTCWGRDKQSARRLLVVTHCIVSISVPVFLADMTCGWLGGCKTWTGYFRYGPKEARMPLNLDRVFEWNVKVVYPTLTAVCLGINLLAFVLLRYLTFRIAFGVIAGKKVETGDGTVIGPHEVDGQVA